MRDGFETNMKKIYLLLSALTLALPALASYHGRVYVDKNHNGIFDKGEKTLAGIMVSDGLNVVKTDKNGEYTLPGYGKEKFLFLTTPSGYKSSGNHYHRIVEGCDVYDFGVQSYKSGIARNGSHRFVQISDTEIFATTDHEHWVSDVREYVANENVAFVIHTGDICYEDGLREHIKLMNTENMNVPMYYCIGNHDLVKGEYGEALYESIYGPVYYSFDAGNVHYVVTPMPHGDHAPGYTRLDVCRWLKNDLANIKEGTPVVIFNHDLLNYNDDFTYKGSDIESINLNDYNLKAWLYGHWHINQITKQGNVYAIGTSSLDKGGIDHATGSFRVLHMDGRGDIRSELRYTYLDKHLKIATPEGQTASPILTVNAYSSSSPVKEITYTCLKDGKNVVRKSSLEQATNWSWTAPIELKPELAGEELTIKVTACFNNGETVQTEKTFVFQPECVSVSLTDDWTNLLGDATHSGRNSSSFAKPLKLAWVKNVGANIFMTSPLVYKGNVYTASVDEDLAGQAYIFALDGQTGDMKWKYAVENSIKNTIAIDAGLVFAQDITGNLYAVDAMTGELRWKDAMQVDVVPGLVDGLVADNGIVYAGSGTGLSAYEASTGKLLWRNKDWWQGEGTTSTLSVAEGVLIGSANWRALHGNDLMTGKKLWSCGDHGVSNRGASAAVHGSLLYLAAGTSFFVIDSATGRIVVRKELPYNLNATSTPVLTENSIVFGSAKDGLIAIDNQTFEEKWIAPVEKALIYTAPYSYAASATIETSPVLVGNTIYFGASDGTLYGVSEVNGKVEWKHQTGAPIFGSVAVSGNSLVASDFGGNVYLYTY